MAYTENDIKENIDAGNLYIKPNIEGSLTIIDDYKRESGLDCYAMLLGTLSVDVTLTDTTSNGYIYFKDDSYIRLELNPTWSGDVTPIVTVIAFNCYFGLNDNGNITEYLISSATGMTGFKESYEYIYSPSTGQIGWIAKPNILYQVGDVFTYNLTWWDIASPKFRYTFYVKTAGAGAFNVGTWVNTSANPNILSNGAMSGYQLQTPVGQIFAEYLSGNKSEGTKYPGDDSTTGGGEGTFYDENHAIPRSQFPTTQPIDWGFNTIYSPSDADMRTIARWLWSDDFSDNIKMNFSSPFENILTLAMVRINLDNHKSISNFIIGNTDSAIQTNKINDEYITVDCGTIDVNERWESFLDYDSMFTIWLPYIGYRSLKPDDILAKTLGVTYKVDLLTGVAVCEVYVINDGLEQVLYSYNCNVYYNVSLSGANYMSMYNQQLSATANGISNFVQSAKNIISGNIVSGITGLFTGQAQAQRQYETAKPDYGRGGNSGGNSGIFSVIYPYLITIRPKQQSPKNYKSLQGVPSQIYAKLSTLTGYTEIETCNINELANCTDEEKAEIFNLLKEGVIL